MSLPRQSDVDSDDDEPESRLVKVDRSNGFDVDDWSLPNCLARCVSGRDRSLTGLLERGLENGEEESSSCSSSKEGRPSKEGCRRSSKEGRREEGTSQEGCKEGLSIRAFCCLGFGSP